MSNFEKPEEPFINEQGYLEHQGRIYNDEGRMMREIGSEITEDLDKLENQPLDKVAREYGVTFIHGTHPTFSPYDNSPLKSKISWFDKVAIVLHDRPELSCSTIEPGDDSSNFWSDVGVVFKKGIIKDARPYDAASQVDENDSRNSTRTSDEKKSLLESNRSAIKDRGSGYNEFIIKNPEVAGLYMVVTTRGLDDIIINKGYHISFDEFLEQAKAFNLPPYIFLKGELYEIEEDEIELDVIINKKYDKPVLNDFNTYYRVTKQQSDDLEGQGIFLNDNVWISGGAIDYLDEKKSKVKLKVVKLKNKADIYNKKNEQDIYSQAGTKQRAA